MYRRTITAVSIALCLCLMTLGIAFAQPASPLAGIPHMSTEPDGPEMQAFPAGTEKLYLVFDYETDGPVEVAVEIRSDSQQGAVLFNKRETYEGTGTANIEVDGPGGTFPDDRYTTIIRFRAREGDQFHPTAGWEWVVGDVELPSDDPDAAQQPFSELDTRGLENPQAGSSSDVVVSSPNLDQSSSALAQTESAGGVPPAILIALAFIVVVLLAVIAWAVRGFMKAA